MMRPLRGIANSVQGSIPEKAFVTVKIYDVLGKEAQALSTYNKALALEPENIGIMDTIARFYLKNKKLDEVFFNVIWSANFILANQ